MPLESQGGSGLAEGESCGSAKARREGEGAADQALEQGPQVLLLVGVDHTVSEHSAESVRYDVPRPLGSDLRMAVAPDGQHFGLLGVNHAIEEDSAGDAEEFCDVSLEVVGCAKRGRRLSVGVLPGGT